MECLDAKFQIIFDTSETLQMPASILLTFPVTVHRAFMADIQSARLVTNCVSQDNVDILFAASTRSIVRISAPQVVEIRNLNPSVLYSYLYKPFVRLCGCRCHQQAASTVSMKAMPCTGAQLSHSAHSGSDPGVSQHSACISIMVPI